jgi:hypothetical protein
MSRRSILFHPRSSPSTPCSITTGATWTINDHASDYAVRSAEQRRLAEASKARLQSHVRGESSSDRRRVGLHPAETYHQDYH